MDDCSLPGFLTGKVRAVTLQLFDRSEQNVSACLFLKVESIAVAGNQNLRNEPMKNLRCLFKDLYCSQVFSIQVSPAEKWVLNVQQDSYSLRYGPLCLKRGGVCGQQLWCWETESLTKFELSLLRYFVRRSKSNWIAVSMGCKWIETLFCEVKIIVTVVMHRCNGSWKCKGWRLLCSVAAVAHFCVKWSRRNLG